jgi:hypothetical protein
MLIIENREQLRIDGELLPLVEQVVSVVARDSKIRSIERAPNSLRHSPGWIVFSDSEIRGVALNLEGAVPSRTNLRLRLNCIGHAQRVVAGFGGRNKFPLWLTDREECPSDWALYRVSLCGGTILCAASSSQPVIMAQAVTRGRQLPDVALSFVGEVLWDGLISVGETRLVQPLKVECHQQRFSGFITVLEGGVMSFQSEEALRSGASEVQAKGELSGALVRLDIGDVELSLNELAALRSGTAIELKAELPLSCFMRVGATTLALGELSLDGHGLVLRITEVVG